MTVVSMSYLLEAGVHFGHQTKRWNPKMKEYIYNSRDDIYIIDLQKTVAKMEEAYEALNKTAAEVRKFHKEMGCVCFENTAMGLYFINDPDDYWIEILPVK